MNYAKLGLRAPDDEAAEWLQDQELHMAGVLRVADGLLWDHRKPLTFLASIGLTIFTPQWPVSGPLTSMPPCKMGLEPRIHLPSQTVQDVGLYPVDLGGTLYFYPPASQSLYPQRRRPCWIVLAVQLPTRVPIRIRTSLG